MKLNRRPNSLRFPLRGAFAVALAVGSLAMVAPPSSAVANPAGWNIALAIGQDNQALQGQNSIGWVASPSQIFTCPAGGCSSGIQMSIGGVVQPSSFTATTENAWPGLPGSPPQTTSDGLSYNYRFDFPGGIDNGNGTDSSFGQVFSATATGPLDAQLQLSCLLPSGAPAPSGVSITLYQVVGGTGPLFSMTAEVQTVPFPWSECPTSNDWSTGPSSSSFAFVDTGLDAIVNAGSQYAILITGGGGDEPWDTTTSISGVVSGSDNGQGIGGVCVNATPTGGGAMTQTTSNPLSGTYYFYGLAPGSYTVTADP